LRKSIPKESIPKKLRKYYGDEDERFPYHYIFKPPEPPDDFALAPQVQVRAPVKEKDSKEEIHCQYCGMKLTKEEQLIHSCQKKPKNKGLEFSMPVLKKVLVVDEEEDISILTEKYLQLEKYDTITCSNGYDALSILEEKHDELALVLLDIMLPGGYEILTKIKSKYPEIRVVLFTLKNFFDAPEIDRCPRCGAIGKDIKTNLPPMIIVNCKLDFPKYTCIKCGYNWGSLL